MAYQSRAKRLGDALAKIEDGMTEVEALAEEIESWRDNMSGTNLENTDKYNVVEECADTIREAYDELENAKGELENIEFPRMFS